MNNQRYVKVVRGSVTYFVREDVLKAHNSGAGYHVLQMLSDFVILNNELVKSRQSVLDLVDNYIENCLSAEVISETKFEAGEIKEHYLEF